MFKNTASQKVTVFAFADAGHASLDAGEPVTGDAANITGKIEQDDDGTRTAIADTNPTETEGGQYVFDLTASETDGDKLTFYPTSSTAGVQVIVMGGNVIYTQPPNLTSLGINASGHVSRVTVADSVTAAVETDAASRTASQATGFSTFNPATDTVVNVGTVATCTANSDMRGTDGANTVTPPASADIADAVWDELSSEHSIAGSFGVYVDSQLSTIRTVVDDTANDITTIQSTLGGSPGVVLTPAQENQIIDGVLDEALASHTTAGSLGKAIADIEVDTNELQTKIIPMLEDDGASGYQYTTLSLENAPSGGGGGGDATLANQTTIISTLGDMSGATFDTSTDSLEAIRNRGDAAWVTGGGGGGIWQLTVTVTDTSANAVQGARVAVDGTSLTVTTDTSGEAVLNLNDGGYTLNISAPSGYDDPAAQSVTISGADDALAVSVSPTSGGGSCEIPPL